MRTLKRAARVVFPLLSVMMIIFIFWQSSMDADSSADESGSLLETLNRFLSSLGIAPFLSDHLIRKAAHFSEYFILGALLFGSMKVWLNKDILILTYPAGAGLLVAACDEFIQTFSNGRSGELKDVLLDFAGVLTAVVALYLLLWLFRDIRKNHRKDAETDEEEKEASADEDDDVVKEDAEEGSADPDELKDNDTENPDITEKRETEIE